MKTLLWRKREPAGCGPAGRIAGYTLVEALVTTALLSLVALLVELALPDLLRDGLERDALRLGAMLDGARAQARLNGRPVLWRALPVGFEFQNEAAASLLRHQWLDARVQVVAPAQLWLSTDPIAPAQSVILSLGTRQVRLSSNGLAPFAIER